MTYEDLFVKSVNKNKTCIEGHKLLNSLSSALNLKNLLQNVQHVGGENLYLQEIEDRKIGTFLFYRFLGGHHLYMYFCVSVCVSVLPSFRPSRIKFPSPPFINVYNITLHYIIYQISVPPPYIITKHNNNLLIHFPSPPLQYICNYIIYQMSVPPYK